MSINTIPRLAAAAVMAATTFAGASAALGTFATTGAHASCSPGQYTHVLTGSYSISATLVQDCSYPYHSYNYGYTTMNSTDPSVPGNPESFLDARLDYTYSGGGYGRYTLSTCYTTSCSASGGQDDFASVGCPTTCHTGDATYVFGIYQDGDQYGNDTAYYGYLS